jgi:CysZ protein
MSDEVIHPDEIIMEDSTGVPETLDDIGGKGVFGRFFGGLKMAISSVGFTFRHKSLRSLAVVPTLIHVALFAGLVATGFMYIGDIIDWAHIDPGGSAFWKFVSSTLDIMVGVFAGTLFLAGGLVGTAIGGNILCGPIYDVLSERTEVLVLGRSHAPAFSFKQLFTDLAQDILLGFFRFLIYLSGLVTIFLIGLIPVIGTVASPILSILWTWLFLALTFTDNSFVRHTINANDRLGTIFSEKAVNLGFGFGAWLCMFFPPLAPALVVGGTRKYLALAARDKVPSKLTEGDKALLRGAPKEQPKLLMDD